MGWAAAGWRGGVRASGLSVYDIFERAGGRGGGGHVCVRDRISRWTVGVTHPDTCGVGCVCDTDRAAREMDGIGKRGEYTVLRPAYV